MSSLFRPSSSSEESEWLSVSDMMAGLMVIFLFIAILPRSQAEEPPAIHSVINDEQPSEETSTAEAEVPEEILCWWKRENDIHNALFEEFRRDLPVWKARIEKNPNRVLFINPLVLFKRGSEEIRPEFKNILEDFFPRFARVLRPFKGSIEELRIEGHTSSLWEGAETEQESYFYNMDLSQRRTRSVLEYVLGDTDLNSDKKWVRDFLTANGLSFSRRIFFPDGEENKKASRRVEFQVTTKTRDVLRGVVGVGNNTCELAKIDE